VSTYPDEEYFKWLYGQIAYPKVKNPARTHWAFAKHLYTREFLWFVPNDDNRAEDGRDLRMEFVQLVDEVHPYDDWMHRGCSMLELLVALSRQLAFLSSGNAREWFWEMVENLGISISHTSDSHYNHEIQEQVDDALNRVIFRTYGANGDGGLFPLVDPKKDQRGVEIWYQLNSYLVADL